MLVLYFARRCKGDTLRSAPRKERPTPHVAAGEFLCSPLEVAPHDFGAPPCIEGRNRDPCRIFSGHVLLIFLGGEGKGQVMGRRK